MFRLRKWYLDLVTPRGDAFIGYAARAQILGVPLHHNAVLLAPAGAPTAEFRTPRSDPVATGDSFLWSAPCLRACAFWRREAPPLRLSLLDSPAGSIHWHCHLPNATAQASILNTSYLGRGYIEELSMTLPPWKFPFATLRWGRFLTRSTSIIWIDWRDGLDRTWVFHNGALDLHARVTDDAILHSHARLDFSRDSRRVLRDAPLARTAFPHLPALARLLPNNLSRARESKFLAPATFHAPTATPSTEEGYALFEVVTWK
jgi:hypothetical protein